MGGRPTYLLRSALAVAIIATEGCTPLKGNDRLAAEGREGGPTCFHREPPPKPNVVGVGGTLDLTFAPVAAYVGTRVTDSGPPGYESIGFDLDFTCTGEGQGPSCVEPPWVTPDRYQDGDSGIDNGSGKMFSAIYPGADDTLPASPDVGDELVRVRGYSGDPDDDQVDVSVYTVWGVSPLPDGGSQASPDAGQLRWDGTDRYAVQPDTLVPLEDGGYDLDQPRYHDPNAYVSGGMLVAHIEEAWGSAGRLWSPGALVHTMKGVLEARLVQGPDGWEMQDLVTAGRIQFNDYWRLLARYPDAVHKNNKPICQSRDIYDQTKRVFCSYLDIAAVDTSPSAPCDAISIGVKIPLSKLARLGDLSPSAPPLADCAPGVDPDTDTCDGGVP
jgi:hypothetical protein